MPKKMYLSCGSHRRKPADTKDFLIPRDIACIRLNPLTTALNTQMAAPDFIQLKCKASVYCTAACTPDKNTCHPACL